MKPVRIHVNDTPRDLAAGASLAALAHELGLAECKGVAIAVNDIVTPRSSWSGHALTDGDRVLIIQATQGG